MKKHQTLPDNLHNVHTQYSKTPLYTPKVILKILGLSYMGWCTAYITFTIIGSFFY